ncbi:uncharacterized protein MONBRDRAFT_12635 [Monosiga brevicollis MX1]|uniref:PARP n=1 Tax=Monosiga brevicollis TaxID=81824 RepID=A9VCV1_MONBE|nr:uncharacterized protein MONBRDRAFT_12635 [Monosiga brevicollis MX1]EDQ84630.1 predicted protein [Monosiga brevicollis MX1]|eukprot:XP_001750534.1 hypothetical protein [Monosiga brevicollis MX1]
MPEVAADKGKNGRLSNAAKAGHRRHVYQNPKTSRIERGWMQQELNRGRTFNTMRNLPGTHIDHTRNHPDFCRTQWASDNSSRGARLGKEGEAIRTRAQPKAQTTGWKGPRGGGGSSSSSGIGKSVGAGTRSAMQAASRTAARQTALRTGARIAGRWLAGGAARVLLCSVPGGAFFSAALLAVDLYMSYYNTCGGDDGGPGRGNREMARDPGGVAVPRGNLEAFSKAPELAADDAAAVLAILIPRAEAELQGLPFSSRTGDLHSAVVQIVVAELATSIYVDNAYPFFSLHFNKDACLYPVLHPLLRETLVGHVIATLDYYLKGFLNGGVYPVEYLMNWHEGSCGVQREELRQHVVDLRTLVATHGGEGVAYKSLLEMLAEAGVADLVRGTDQPEEATSTGKTTDASASKFRTSFRIIGTLERAERDGDVVALVPGFRVEYTVETTPAYQKVLDAHLAEHGVYPDGYATVQRVYARAARAAEQVMPRIPLFAPYFAMLRIITACSALVTSLRSTGKLPLLSLPVDAFRTGANCKLTRLTPPLYPPLPVRYYKQHVISIRLLDLVNQLRANDNLSALTLDSRHTRAFEPSKLDREMERLSLRVFEPMADVTSAVQAAVATLAQRQLPSEVDFASVDLDALQTHVQNQLTAVADAWPTVLLPRMIVDTTRHLLATSLFDDEPSQLPNDGGVDIEAHEKAVRARMPSKEVTEQLLQPFLRRLSTIDTVPDRSTAVRQHFADELITAFRASALFPPCKFREESRLRKQILHTQTQLREELAKIDVYQRSMEKATEEYRTSQLEALAQEVQDLHAGFDRRVLAVPPGCAVDPAAVQAFRQWLADQERQSRQQIEERVQRQVTSNAQALDDARRDVNQKVQKFIQGIEHTLQVEPEKRLMGILSEKASAYSSQLADGIVQLHARQSAIIFLDDKTIKGRVVSRCLGVADRSFLNGHQEDPRIIGGCGVSLEDLEDSPLLATTLSTAQAQHLRVSLALKTSAGSSTDVNAQAVGATVTRLDLENGQSALAFRCPTENGCLASPSEATLWRACTHDGRGHVTPGLGLVMAEARALIGDCLEHDDSVAEVKAKLLTLVKQSPSVVSSLSQLAAETEPATGATLLHVAAAFACPNATEVLLEAGANAMATDNEQATPLHYAAAAAAALLEEGSRGSANDPDTSPHQAVGNFAGEHEAPELATVRLLVNAGASPFVRQGAGLTPLFVACQGNAAATALAMLDTHKAGGGCDVNVGPDSDMMPLHCAVAHDMAAVAARLVQCGGSLERRRRADGASPFLYACMRASHSTLDAMLSAAKNVPDIDHMLEGNYNCLHCLAAYSGNKSLASCSDLLQSAQVLQAVYKGASWRSLCCQKDSNGRTPAELALGSGLPELAMLLGEQLDADSELRCLQAALAAGAESFLRAHAGRLPPDLARGCVKRGFRLMYSPQKTEKIVSDALNAHTGEQDATLLLTAVAQTRQAVLLRTILEKQHKGKLQVAEFLRLAAIANDVSLVSETLPKADQAAMHASLCAALRQASLMAASLLADKLNFTVLAKPQIAEVVEAAILSQNRDGWALIARFVAPDDMQQLPSCRNGNALHLAVTSGATILIPAIAAAGVSSEQLDDDGRSPLELAVAMSSPALVETMWRVRPSRLRTGEDPGVVRDTAPSDASLLTRAICHALELSDEVMLRTLLRLPGDGSKAEALLRQIPAAEKSRLLRHSIDTGALALLKFCLGLLRCIPTPDAVAAAAVKDRPDLVASLLDTLAGQNNPKVLNEAVVAAYEAAMGVSTPVLGLVHLMANGKVGTSTSAADACKMCTTTPSLMPLVQAEQLAGRLRAVQNAIESGTVAELRHALKELPDKGLHFRDPDTGSPLLHCLLAKRRLNALNVLPPGYKLNSLDLGGLSSWTLMLQQLSAQDMNEWLQALCLSGHQTRSQLADALLCSVGGHTPFELGRMGLAQTTGLQVLATHVAVGCEDSEVDAVSTLPVVRGAGKYVGCTALHVLCSEAGASAVQAYLAALEERGASPAVMRQVVNARDRQGRTPLMCLAASRGTDVGFAALTRAGAEFDAVDGCGRGVLHHAIAASHTTWLGNVLLDPTTASLLPRGPDADGRRPAMLAAQLGLGQVLRLLLLHRDEQEHLCTPDVWGHTALTLAASEGHDDLVCMLVDDYGVDPDAVCEGPLKVDIQQRSMSSSGLAAKAGMTAIHLAAQRGHMPVVRALHHRGVSVSRPNVHGQTALQLLLSAGRADAIDLLSPTQLMAVANEPQMGASLLSAAARGNLSTTILNLVHLAGIAVDAADAKTLMTPLHVAAATGALQSVRALLDLDADFLACDCQGRTPLHMAIECRQPDAAAELLRAALEEGEIKRLCAATTADIVGGATALHVAAEANDVATTARLLRAGADVNKPDARGNTPALCGLRRHGDGGDLRVLQLHVAYGDESLASRVKLPSNHGKEAAALLERLRYEKPLVKPGEPHPHPRRRLYLEPDDVTHAGDIRPLLRRALERSSSQLMELAQVQLRSDTSNDGPKTTGNTPIAESAGATSSTWLDVAQESDSCLAEYFVAVTETTGAEDLLETQTPAVMTVAERRLAVRQACQGLLQAHWHFGAEGTKIAVEHLNSTNLTAKDVSLTALWPGRKTAKQALLVRCIAEAARGPCEADVLQFGLDAMLRCAPDSLSAAGASALGLVLNQLVCVGGSLWLGFVCTSGAAGGALADLTGFAQDTMDLLSACQDEASSLRALKSLIPNALARGAARIECKKHRARVPAVSPKPSAKGPAVSPKPSAKGPAVAPKPSAKGPAVAPKPSAKGPAVALKPSAKGPAVALKPSAKGPAVAPKPSAKGPAVAPKPSAKGPAVAPKPSAKGPAVALKPSTKGPAVAPKPSAKGPAAAARGVNLDRAAGSANTKHAQITSTPHLKDLRAAAQQALAVALASAFPDHDVEHVEQSFAKDVSHPLSPDVLAHCTMLFDTIEKAEQRLSAMDMSGVVAEARQLGQHLAKRPGCGFPHSTDDEGWKQCAHLLAVLRVTARRRLGVRPYTTQLFSLLALLHGMDADGEGLQGRVAQIRTGEGKSLLLALLVAYLALCGRTVDVVTSSDGLATRDQAEFASFYEEFGLRGAHICREEPQPEHFEAPIVYGTNAAFEFGVLRAMLGWPGAAVASNGAPRLRDVVVVDEVDNMLIDTALSPARLARPRLHDWTWLYEPIWHFVEKVLNAESTSAPCSRLRSHLNSVLLPSLREQLADVPDDDLGRLVASALAARSKKRNVDYVVQNDEVLIVDWAHTGQLQHGSRWSGGVHQFVEVKEGLEPKSESLTVASLAHPSFFNGYRKLVGVSGTIGSVGERSEIGKMYNTSSFDAPTHRTRLLKQLPTILVDGDYEKVYLPRLCEEVVRAASGEQARPVLVLCATLRSAQQVTAALARSSAAGSWARLQQLTKVQAEDEALIVLRAGKPGTVTVATNAAGRGTDVRLASESIRSGGLHVLITFLPANLRVEEQGLGRAGRQGQPGTGCLFIHTGGTDQLVHTLTQGTRCASTLGVKQLFTLREAYIEAQSEARMRRAALERRLYGLLYRFSQCLSQFRCITVGAMEQAAGMPKSSAPALTKALCQLRGKAAPEEEPLLYQAEGLRARAGVVLEEAWAVFFSQQCQVTASKDDAYVEDQFKVWAQQWLPDDAVMWLRGILLMPGHEEA